MLERFTKEKQRAAKGSGRGVDFNLGDDGDEDGEELGLTHYGQSLSALDDFDGTGLALEDDEDEGDLYARDGESSYTKVLVVFV